MGRVRGGWYQYHVLNLKFWLSKQDKDKNANIFQKSYCSILNKRINKDRRKGNPSAPNIHYEYTLRSPLSNLTSHSNFPFNYVVMISSISYYLVTQNITPHHPTSQHFLHILISLLSALIIYTALSHLLWFLWNIVYICPNQYLLWTKFIHIYQGAYVSYWPQTYGVTVYCWTRHRLSIDGDYSYPIFDTDLTAIGTTYIHWQLPGLASLISIKESPSSCADLLRSQIQH
jgi:hypothetical protein